MNKCNMDINKIIKETINEYIMLNEYHASPDVHRMIGECIQMVERTYNAALQDIRDNNNGSKNEFVINVLREVLKKMHYVYVNTDSNKRINYIAENKNKRK